MKQNLNWRQIFADRLTQIIIGCVFLFLSSGIGIYQVGTDGGHGDFATYRLLPDGADARRKLANAHRLKSLYGPMRPKMEAVIADMESNGWYPLVDVGIYRTPAQQMAKYRAGVSKVKWSFHNATNADGTPGSLAADITDRRYGWSSKCPKAYWLQLASAARAHGLRTGAVFGLSRKPRELAALENAVKHRQWNAPVQIGWDPSHTEPIFSIAKAGHGARPKF